MKKQLLVSILVLAFATVIIRAECIDGEEERSNDSEESDVSLFFKKVQCALKKGVIKAQEGAKKLGIEIKERAKKFKESAKNFKDDVKVKVGEWKEKFSTTSSEESKDSAKSLFANVEMIDPDILKAEQKCGKGFILDALGACKQN